MTELDDRRGASGHLQTALEASCGALITLESIYAQTAVAPIEVRALQAHLTEAMNSLRQATAELRLAGDEEPSVLGLGFVIRPAAGRSRAGSRRVRHPSPRRTA